MSTNGTITPAQPRLQPCAAPGLKRPDPGQEGAAPKVAAKHAKLKKLLYQATGINPFSTNDLTQELALDAYLDKILADGKIAKDELVDLLEKYYDIENVQDSPLAAFTGKKGDFALNVAELERCLQIFNKIGMIKGYTLGWFLHMKEVYIVGGKELGPTLKFLKNTLLSKSNPNPEIANIWEAAKACTNGDETEQTYQWFGTILTSKFVEKFVKAGEIDQLEEALGNKLSRQLLGEHVINWARTNQGISETDMDKFQQRLEGIEELKDNNIPIEGILLFKDGQGKINSQSLKLLDQAITLINDGDEQGARKIIARLLNMSDQAGNPQHRVLGDAIPVVIPR